MRDATARLPNGQGTRADICMLLRDSQYLIDTALDGDLNSVVSGALDRLHYEPDPCVKYDTKRKIWIYLHRCVSWFKLKVKTLNIKSKKLSCEKHLISEYLLKLIDYTE